MNIDDVLKKYNKDGYVVLKNVFSKQEIDACRDAISKLPSLRGDVLTHGSIRDILLDDRVIFLLKAILRDVVYFGDSCIQSEKKEGFRSFHRDSQLDFEDPTKTEYPIVRLGIYMQDHTSFSGGLKVRKGSHRFEYVGKQNIFRVFFSKPHGPLSWKAIRFGKSVNLDIEPGDLAIWNLRTWHSGHAVRLKLFSKLSINPKLEKYIPKFLARPSVFPRMVIFSSFGSPSSQLDTYINERSNHPSNQEFWKECKFNTPDVLDLCRKKGIALRFDALRE